MVSAKGLLTQFILFSVLFLIVFGIPFHFWMVNQKGFLQTVFPISGLFSAGSVSCSAGSPEWQKNIMLLGVWQMRAPASQSAFIDRGGVLHHCESGWENGILLSKRVSAASKFQFGSLTKPVTSALVIDLVNQGKIEFGTSVSAIFEAEESRQPEEIFEELTIDKLLKYESGVAGEIFLENGTPWCPYRMGDLFKKKPWFAPIGEHRYNNLNYCILGEVISNLHGASYRDVLYKLFDFQSLGIEFVNAPSEKGWVFPDYRYHEFYRKDIQPSFDYNAISSTAGLGGSASGYARLISSLIDSNLLSYKSDFDVSCNRKVIRNCYGRSFYFYEAKNGKIFNVKEGHMPGFSSLLLVNEDEEVFVWLGNSDTPDARSGKEITALFDLFPKSGFW